MLKIIFSISLVALVVLSANFLTSSATTANPLPASPALAASIAALRAKRLVWSAISLITVNISPICEELSKSLLIVSYKCVVFVLISSIVFLISPNEFCPCVVDSAVVLITCSAEFNSLVAS